MNKARQSIMAALNRAIQEYELPAYIMEYIVSDILGELRQSSTAEMLNEMEREQHGNMEQGIQQNKLAE